MSKKTRGMNTINRIQEKRTIGRNQEYSNYIQPTPGGLSVSHEQLIHEKYGELFDSGNSDLLKEIEEESQNYQDENQIKQKDFDHIVYPDVKILSPPLPPGTSMKIVKPPRVWDSSNFDDDDEAEGKIDLSPDDNSKIKTIKQTRE